MPAPFYRRLAVAMFASGLLGLVPVAAHGDNQATALGFDDLIARLGGDTPTGVGVIAGQVEAPDGNDNWAPDPNRSFFDGIDFIFESGTPSGFSGHANTVGRHYYGSQNSIATGISTVHAWEVNDWLTTGYLRLGQGTIPPDQTNVDVMNNSWIGTGGAIDNEVLRRVDFSVNDQDQLVVVGVGNGSGWGNQDRLLSHGFNVISVGRSDGNHHFGLTLGALDNPGRMKPEIVAPDNATSWTTALVSSVCAILLETSRTWPGLDTNVNADEPEVIKAALLAGARHRALWTNRPQSKGPDRGVTETPLDEVFGVDQANVNTSHMILTGLEQDGQATPPVSGTVLNTGWDFDAVARNASRFYRFEIHSMKEHASILVTWNRQIATTQFVGAAPPVADLDLELFRVQSGNQLVSLRGDNGLDAFGSGNIASVSAVDNIEHLFIRDLAPGTYMLEVRRNNDNLASQTDFAVAWFMPPDEGVPATLDAFVMNFGRVIEGDLASLLASDDNYLRTASTFGFSASESNITEVQFNFTAQSAIVDSLSVAFEGQLNNPGGNAQIRMKNFANNGLFELVHEAPIGLDEVTIAVPGLGAEFVNPNNNRIRMRVRQTVIATFSASGFESLFDHVQAMTVN